MTSNETETAKNHASGTTVWDPVVRFGHWALVVAFAIAYLSAEEEVGGPDALHVWGGYAVGVIIILRRACFGASSDLDMLGSATSLARSFLLLVTWWTWCGAEPGDTWDIVLQVAR